MSGDVRKFDTGATRSADTGRYDPEGFMSPIVIERFSEYMNKHRKQPDGSIRASDNWQKGIPRETYVKGMWRHFLHLWTRHRGFEVQDPMAAADIEEDLCALLFNVQGMLFEVLKDKRRPAAVVKEIWPNNGLLAAKVESVMAEFERNFPQPAPSAGEATKGCGALDWDRPPLPKTLGDYVKQVNESEGGHPD